MTRPEEALEAARAAAERKRRAGSYGEGEHGLGDSIERSIAPERPGTDQLKEWSLIEVDPSLIYSTRRLGAPMTGLKRLLLRLLHQYTNELEAQQTRFNVALLAHLRELEQRLERLEGERAGGERRE